MAITASTIYSQAWQSVFNIMNGSLTDPKGRSNKWVFGAMPDIKDEAFTTDHFPVVVVNPVEADSARMTMSNDPIREVSFTIPITAYSTSASQLDTLSDDIYKQIDTNRASLEGSGLFRIDVEASSSDTDIINDKLRVHSREIPLSCVFHHGG